jgi:hypothetical protein
MQSTLSLFTNACLLTYPHAEHFRTLSPKEEADEDKPARVLLNYLAVMCVTECDVFSSLCG